MKIETLVNLIGGELLNSPYISEVVHFTDDVEDVNRGSCFFVKKISDIPQAIKNGAYAIIADKDISILDKEIAWIKVENVKKALFNIFKYENITNQIYFTDEITLSIIKKMNLEKKVIVLKNDEDFFKAINLREKYILTDNKKFKEIFANIVDLKSKNIKLIQKGLFRCEFNQEEIKIPFVYKNFFAKALNFFDTYDLKYTLDFEIERFKPVFINALFEEVEFGKSEKVVITGIKNDKFFFDELNYIIENTKYAKTVFINNSNKTLLNKPFNFAVMVDCEFTPKIREEKRFFND
ncbi:hypothetical protein [Caminibacter sp.]